MCGRFTQQRPASELAEIFGATSLVDDEAPRFNLAPTQPALVVVQRDGVRAVTTYRWGLIPPWAEKASVGSRMFNARAETVGVSPAFRDAYRRRRCIVPVDAFYEWRRDGATRTPFAISAEDARPLALAGVWAGWRDPATDLLVRSFAIVTTKPNDLMATIHDRMPVVLDAAGQARWLDVEGTDPAELHRLLVPCRADALAVREISTRVNDVRNDGPDLLLFPAISG